MNGATMNGAQSRTMKPTYADEQPGVREENVPIPPRSPQVVL